VTGALGALDATSGGGDKLRVAFVEQCLFQEQEDIMLYPLLQVSHREQYALGLRPGSVPLLAEAIGECLFLLCWLQFGEQQRVAYADFLGIESLYDWRGKFRQANSGGLCCQFAYVAIGGFDPGGRVDWNKKNCGQNCHRLSGFIGAAFGDVRGLPLRPRLEMLIS
jgi:hypothetical protein